MVVPLGLGPDLNLSSMDYVGVHVADSVCNIVAASVVGVACNAWVGQSAKHAIPATPSHGYPYEGFGILDPELAGHELRQK